MDIKTKDYRRQPLKSDSKSIKTKRMMKRMTIKSKQTLQKQPNAYKNTADEGENRYAVNRSEDTAKAAARMGKAYAVRQMKKKVQQKRFEKECITPDPIKASGESFSSSNSFDSVERYEGSVGTSSNRPIKALQTTAKPNFMGQVGSYGQKTAEYAVTQNHRKRVMRRWNRRSLLQKQENSHRFSMMNLPGLLLTKKEGGSKVGRTLDVEVKRRSPIYLMIMGFLLLMVVIVLLFSSAMAVIGEDEIAGDIPANGTIVDIAESQIGNKGGRPYWSWYGFTEHVDWCACFVSWCADKCGYIESGDFPKFSYCQDGVNWFIQKKDWYRRTISPSPGMIIFFDWDNNGTADHVGIVKSCKDNIVHTIEGNSGDMCKENWYTVGNKMIMGYGGV